MLCIMHNIDCCPVVVTQLEWLASPSHLPSLANQKHTTVNIMAVQSHHNDSSHDHLARIAGVLAHVLFSTLPPAPSMGKQLHCVLLLQPGA